MRYLQLKPTIMSKIGARQMDLELHPTIKCFLNLLCLLTKTNVVVGRGCCWSTGRRTPLPTSSGCPLILITALSWSCGTNWRYNTCMHLPTHRSKHSTVQRGCGCGARGGGSTFSLRPEQSQWRSSGEPPQHRPVIQVHHASAIR